MRVLLTGATGFLGSRLSAFMDSAGDTVGLLYRSDSVIPPGIAHLRGWIVGPDGAGMREALLEFRPDVVVHLATHYVAEHSFEDIGKLVGANILFGTRLLDAMRHTGASRLVYAGTSWQHYKNSKYLPVNLYAATKQAFTTIVDYYRDEAGLRLLELHLYDIYGEGDKRGKLPSQLQAAAEARTELAMSAGEQRVHFVHVDDACGGFSRACRQIMEFSPGERRVYRLPSSRAVSLRELVGFFNAAIPDVPVKVDWGKRPYRAREVFEPWEKAEVLPGWTPLISLEEGFRRYRSEMHGCRARLSEK